MSRVEVVKAGIFSARYTYLLTSDGRYSLIESSRVARPEELVGRRVRGPADDDGLDGHAVNGLRLRVTVPRLLGVVVALIACTVLVWPMGPSGMVVVWSLVLHELGHIGVAVAQGARELYLGFRLQYRIFPIVYISNRTIYEQTRLQRTLYYSGGVMVNFTLGAVCLALLATVSDLGEAQQHVLLAARCNIFLGLINLYPLLFTDGFNLLREALEIYDLRRLVISHFMHPRALLVVSRAAFSYYIFVLFSVLLLLARLLAMGVELL